MRLRIEWLAIDQALTQQGQGSQSQPGSNFVQVKTE